MRKQDFYGLPRAIQDRFIESSRGVAAPVPVAVYPRSETQSLLWWSLSLLTAASWAGFTALGVGDLHSSFALSSPLHRLLHMAFAAVTLFCAFRAYAINWVMGRLPYAIGDYLFPSGVISASFGQLVEWDSREIKSVEPRGDKIVVRFPDRTFTFLGESEQRAADVVEVFGHQREAWKGVADGEPLDRARLHPLTDSGVPNPLAPTDSHERPRFLSVAALGSIALVLGVGLGLGVALWRDSLSRKALYRHAIAEDSVSGYQAYLARGGERGEVRELLLPRAELKLAIAQGSVAAIQQFEQRHPNTQIAGEVQNALRTALLRELEQARAVGTLDALHDLTTKFPAHELIASEIAAAKQAIYDKALADFRAVAGEASDIVPFVQKLLGYAQANGPVVKLRYHQEFPQDRERVDQIVSKAKKFYMGSKSLPSQYLVGDHARRREQKFLETVRTRLQQAFPADILRFELDEPAPGENVAPGPPTVPTLTFLHRSQLSGGYVGGAPKAMYMGVALHMSSVATIPGDPEEYVDFRWNAWRSPKFTILAEKEKDIPDIYEEMIGGAFDRYAELYLNRWFAAP